MREIAKTISKDQIEKLQDAILLIFEMPQDQRAIRISANDFIAVISKLLGEIGGEKAGKEISQFIQYALDGLNHPVTISSSSECFMYLCQDNATYLAPYGNELVQKVMKPEFVQTMHYK